MKKTDKILVTGASGFIGSRLLKMLYENGYTNLRDTPGGSVIKKVNEGDKFELLERGKTYSKVKLSDGTVGFMHNSRIVPAN
jgi:nucleoside-diphosphate-sugar epimerase